MASYWHSADDFSGVSKPRTKCGEGVNSCLRLVIESHHHTVFRGREAPASWNSPFQWDGLLGGPRLSGETFPMGCIGNRVCGEEVRSRASDG